MINSLDEMLKDKHCNNDQKICNITKFTHIALFKYLNMPDRKR